MVDNKESFEDEFDFLNEEEFEDDSMLADTASPAATPPKPMPTPKKLLPGKSAIILIALGVVGVVAIIIFSLLPTSKSDNATDLKSTLLQSQEASKPADQATVDPSDTTATAATPDTPTPPGTTDTTTTTTTTGATTTTKTAGATADSLPIGEDLDLAAILEGSNEEEKSRAEIAQLFSNKTDKNNKNKSLDTQSLLDDTGKPNVAKAKEDLVSGQAKAGDKTAPPPLATVTTETTTTTEDAETANTEIKASLTNINKDLNQHSNQIQQLKGTLKEISATLTQLNQSIGNMDTRVLGLTQTVTLLTNDLTTVKKVVSDEDLDLASNSRLSAAPTRPSLTYKAPEYVVHAIIPGRAWLKSASGQIITIAEGDVVGDYGTVAIIDAANNIVRTSSGVVFR